MNIPNRFDRSRSTGGPSRLMNFCCSKVFLFIFVLFHFQNCNGHSHDEKERASDRVHAIDPVVYNEASDFSTGPAKEQKQNLDSSFTIENFKINHKSKSEPINHDSLGRMSIANMTCGFFEQPLNHFLPRGKSPTYNERYCTFEGYATTSQRNNKDVPPPIFFYTGNESPLEQYINQTGLMWELAPKFGARIVFVEHRYEGQSLPNLSKDCLSYASTIQAVQDYARILEEKINPGNLSPVIVFGGSYGGMLSAWMRMKYPHLVTGAIAASAPIGAFPQSADTKIDYSARVIAKGIERPYPPTKTATKQKASIRDDKVPIRNARDANGEEINQDEKNYCRDNLLAAWPLISWLASQEGNAEFLRDSFSMCKPLVDNDPSPLLHWAQRVWFDLAEGSFPYPSSYIPFALLHKKVDLPPWPTQYACWKSSQLHRDWGVRFRGSTDDVKFQVDYGDSEIRLDVDWDSVNLANDTEQPMLTTSDNIRNSKDIVGLLTSVRDAVSIWYNITKDVECYNISQAAPNEVMKSMPRTMSKISPLMSSENKKDLHASLSRSIETGSEFDPVRLCHDAMVDQGSWGPICCNDEMNLVITDAQGMGSDFFWPPSHPESVRTYKDLIRNATLEPCPDPYGIYGYSKEPYEPLSMRLDTYYGGAKMEGHSNIVFSNGLLDPWSAGGVYENTFDMLSHELLEEDAATIRNITENDVVALIIPFGGHHTDLMYSSPMDPDCVTEGRNIEAAYISRWIQNSSR